MDFKSIRVLVTDGDGKQPLAMIRGLKELGCHVTVLCTSKMDTCYVSNKPDRKILKKDLRETDEKYFEYVLSLISTGEYDVLMPIAEKNTDFVTRHEEDFKKYVKLACAPRDIYIKAFDKQTTFEQAMKSGIPCPYTRKKDQDIEDFLHHVKFPIIIKPRSGSGSIGFHKFNTEEEFRERLADESFNVDEYVVQEFIHFDHRIGTNLFVDKKGNICTSYAVDVLRWFPPDGGPGVMIQTVDAHEILQYAGKLLQDLGWQGFANVAIMIDKATGEPRLLEINGRIPASVKVAYMLGYNVSQQLLQMIYDEEVIQYPENTQFGKYIRHFDTDLAWFINSSNRFKSKPSWFSWKNTQEVTFSKDDMKPFFVTLYKKIMSYDQRMKKKSHQ